MNSKTLRSLGFALMSVGFLGGAFFMVQFPSSVPWTSFAIPAVVCAIGSAMMRMAQKSAGAEEGKVSEDLSTIERSLGDLVDRVKTMNADKDAADVDVFSFSTRIDDECMELINDFVEAREAMIHRYGLPAYASMMDAFALGERSLNRCWCASADGYIDEVKICLERAETNLVIALGVVRSQKSEA